MNVNRLIKSLPQNVFKEIIALMLLIFPVLCTPVSGAEFVENDPKVLEPITRYYEALENQDSFTLSRLVAPWSSAVEADLLQKSDVKRENITTWSEEAEDDGFIVVVKSDITLNGKIQTVYSDMYLFREDSGSLKIASPEYTEKDLEKILTDAQQSEEVQRIISGNWNAENAETDNDLDNNDPGNENDFEVPGETDESESSFTGDVPEEKMDMEIETEVYDVRLEYIFPDSGTRYLTLEEVNNCSVQAVNYAKNEIYAVHGRLFNSQELREYFSSKSWYNGFIKPEDFSDSVFNEYERANIQLLSENERERTGKVDGYPLDQLGYDINAVGTASYAGKEVNNMYNAEQTQNNDIYHDPNAVAVG